MPLLWLNHRGPGNFARYVNPSMYDLDQGNRIGMTQ